MTTHPAWYDEHMAGTGAPAMLGLNESPWLPLYREAASWVPLNHDVVDLGCGTGRFISLLAYESRHNGDDTVTRTLTGIDFSPDAIAEAEKYNLGRASFSCEDLRDWVPDPMRAGSTTYSCLEVLEHLDDDRDLIRSVPPGHQLIFSVPNYESESHQRWFRTLSMIWRRYEGLVEFRRWSLIALDDRKAIHVLDSVRRLDSW